MMMFRNLLLASVIALGAASAAMAQEGPRLVGGNGGGGPEVVYDNGLPGNVVGGAQVRMSGGAQDRVYSYGQVNTFQGQVGRLVGGGAEAHVVYEPVQHANGIASVETGAPGG
jgi:hypothetical protein